MSSSPMRPSLLELIKYRFGNPTCNLEHRRVNCVESRWLRVERKTLVSFPTLNKHSQLFQRTIRAIPRRVRFAIARESSRALQFTSSFVSVRLWSRYVNVYASDFLPSPISVAGKRSNNSTRSSNGSVGWKITSHIFSWVKSSGMIIAMSRETAGNFPSSRKFARDPTPLIGKSSDTSATKTSPDASTVEVSEFVSCPARPTT